LRRLDLRKAQAARLNTIRDINRQIVLNYVREREPISRAEIARETALQRSTISAIVEDLKSEGLVEEVGEGESTGGRRPTLLKLRAAGPIALGVSITPTCTTIATSDLAGRVIDQEEFLTDSDKTINQVIEIVSDFTARYKGSIEGVGVSLPGLVDPSTGTALYIPYFLWRDLPIAEMISSAAGLPTTMPTPLRLPSFGSAGPKSTTQEISSLSWLRKASVPGSFLTVRFIAASVARRVSLATW
jgi:DNA-binding transcriptional ArsR family regulator